MPPLAQISHFRYEYIKYHGIIRCQFVSPTPRPPPRKKLNLSPVDQSLATALNYIHTYVPS